MSLLFRKLAHQYAKLTFKNALIFKNIAYPLQLPVFDSNNKTFSMTNAIQLNKLENCTIYAEKNIPLAIVVFSAWSVSNDCKPSLASKAYTL